MIKRGSDPRDDRKENTLAMTKEKSPLTLTLSLRGEREFTVFGLNTVFVIANQF
jgi:hypothetical protein